MKVAHANENAITAAMAKELCRSHATSHEKWNCNNPILITTSAGEGAFLTAVAGS
jgi:hypothetical protein